MTKISTAVRRLRCGRTGSVSYPTPGRPLPADAAAAGRASNSSKPPRHPTGSAQAAAAVPSGQTRPVDRHFSPLPPLCCDAGTHSWPCMAMLPESDKLNKQKKP